MIPVLLSSLELFVFRQQQAHKLLTFIVETFRLAWLVTRKSISRNQRKRHCRVDITYNCIGKSIGIDLAPGHCFTRSCSRQAASVGTRVSHLQKIIVTTFIDAEHFLNLRFGLQEKILW